MCQISTRQHPGFFGMLSCCLCFKKVLMIKKNGYTLLEIIFVIIIISVMTSFALPAMTSTFERFRAAEGVQIITALLHAQKAYMQETGSYTNDLTDLDITIDNPEYFTPSVNDTDPIAEAERIGGRYTLEMSNISVITCSESGSGGFSCDQAGY